MNTTRTTLAALSLALSFGAASAAELSWTATSYLTKADQATGEFSRRGLAMFGKGEVVHYTMEGRILSVEGNVQTYSSKIVYTFDDGSTLVQEGQGRVERQSPARNTQTGTGRFTSGTGRWAGVSGSTSSTGRGLTAQGDSYTEFKAEYTLPAK